MVHRQSCTSPTRTATAAAVLAAGAKAALANPQNSPAGHHTPPSPIDNPRALRQYSNATYAHMATCPKHHLLLTTQPQHAAALIIRYIPTHPYTVSAVLIQVAKCQARTQYYVTLCPRKHANMQVVCTHAKVKAMCRCMHKVVACTQTIQ